MRHLPGHQQSILFIAEGESASSLTSAVAVSASTLAEDVRQLAQWCKSADDAREQQERRVEQLERMPPLQAHLKALQDKASNSGNPTHPIPPHPIPSHPIPPHPTPPHPTPPHPIPSHTIPSHPIPSPPIPPPPPSLPPSHPIPSHPIPPHPTPFHPMPSHPTSVAGLCSTPCSNYCMLPGGSMHCAFDTGCSRTTTLQARSVSSHLLL